MFKIGGTKTLFSLCSLFLFSHWSSNSGISPVRVYFTEQTWCEETMWTVLSCPAVRALKKRLEYIFLSIQFRCKSWSLRGSDTKKKRKKRKPNPNIIFVPQVLKFLLPVEMSHRLEPTHHATKKKKTTNNDYFSSKETISVSFLNSHMSPTLGCKFTHSMQSINPYSVRGKREWDVWDRMRSKCCVGVWKSYVTCDVWAAESPWSLFGKRQIWLRCRHTHTHARTGNIHQHNLHLRI